MLSPLFKISDDGALSLLKLLASVPRFAQLLSEVLWCKGRELKAELKQALVSGKIALAPKALLVDLSTR